MRCPVVVGRDVELARLAGAIDGAAAGAGSCVLVVGEAGVGKTQLVSEAAPRAVEDMAVSSGCSPTDRASPLRPLTEALLGALRDLPRPDDPGLGAYLPALGTMVPHWADPDRGLAAVAPAPVVLAEAVLRVLRWLGAGGAAVLVLEDLHWADRERLTALEYLVDNVAAVPLRSR